MSYHGTWHDFRCDVCGNTKLAKTNKPQGWKWFRYPSGPLGHCCDSCAKTEPTKDIAGRPTGELVPMGTAAINATQPARSTNEWE